MPIASRFRTNYNCILINTRCIGFLRKHLCGKTVQSKDTNMYFAKKSILNAQQTDPFIAIKQFMHFQILAYHNFNIIYILLSYGCLRT